MKVCHICLCGPVTDGFSYQENLLSKYHAFLGIDVSMIASLYYYTTDGQIARTIKSGYFNNDGVKMYRLEIVKGDINNKFRRYKGLYQSLCKIAPDIIFVHGCQFLDIKAIIKYKKQHKAIKMYADNHADFSNSATNFISRYILHGMIWRRCAKRIYPYVEKFYGVTPGRVDFLKEVYGLKGDKLELLVMGADDEKVKEALDGKVRGDIREKYGVSNDAFLIMTGGKIDCAKKQTLLLMEAVSGIKGAYLIVFGSVEESLKEAVNKRTAENVKYIGWVDAEDSYKYFAAADLAVFPGRHSVFWEQTAGLGVPMIVKRWSGNEHIDAGGNCMFLDADSTDEIKEKIELLLNHKDIYDGMKRRAKLKGMKKFSYLEIAKRSIQFDM